MICPNCRMQLPEDSVFCQYCGLKLIAPVNQVSQRAKMDTSEQNTMHKEPLLATASGRSSMQNNETNKQTNNTLLGKRTTQKWIVLVICLIMLLLVMTSLCAYQYLSDRNSAARVAELSETIAELDSQIDKKNSEITKLKDKASSLENDAKKYDLIVDAVRSRSIGYSTNNFQSSESIIVVDRKEINRKFTLIAYWSNGGSVSVDYNTSSPAAYVDFDQESWDKSTLMTVQPKHSGVTIVTFSNDVNSKTFDVIIIVE